MKIKTSELSGVALDWAVAMAVGLDPMYRMTIPGDSVVVTGGEKYQPSTNWGHGGPLIEQYRIHVDMMIYDDIVRYWEANIADMSPYEIGDTPLEAVCRAIVSAKLGDEVDVPEGLV